MSACSWRTGRGTCKVLKMHKIYTLQNLKRVKWLMIFMFTTSWIVKLWDHVYFSFFIFQNCVKCFFKTNVQPTLTPEYLNFFFNCIKNIPNACGFYQCHLQPITCPTAVQDICCYYLIPKTNILPREGSIPQGPSIVQF